MGITIALGTIAHYTSPMKTMSPPENRVRLSGISWAAYLELMGEHEHDGRFAYDNGELEIMTVGPEHETTKQLISRLLEYYTILADVEMASAGNFTMLREDLAKGIEADDCYYIQSVSQVPDFFDIDLTRDPPPDLALEIDITHPTLNKLRIYAAIGVGEVWRYRGDHLEVLLRQNAEAYELSETSRALPGFPLSAVEIAIDQRRNGWNDTRILRSFRESLDAP